MTKHTFIQNDYRVSLKILIAQNKTFPLIIADPIYDDYSAYTYLETIAPRLLASNGNLIMFTNSKHLCRTVRVLHYDPTVLTVFKQMHGNLSGSSIDKDYHALWGGSQRTISQSHKIPTAWTSNHWMMDVSTSHKWTKNPEFIALLVKNLTRENEEILDVFCGHGLVSCVAKTMRRYSTAVDVGEDAICFAKANIDGVREALMAA